MAAIEQDRIPDRHPSAGQAVAAPQWSGFLHRIVGSPRGLAGEGGDIYRIDRTEDALWTVTRPGATLEHGFDDLAAAVSFIRHESAGKSATVELRIGGVYAVAYLRPGDPRSLFGEAA